MKLHFLASLLLAVIVLAVALILTTDNTVPSELLVLLGSLSTYLLGVFSHNPTIGED